ncbi:elongation factor P hydroxylase [Alteromonas pelagimontana]|uniref:Elongation factor P hydroxylase n=1 Tax=Alteromonas pelagimontana TaxID=1858656 RepID=A0A6M4MHW3_9ALTE|nr:elongation factor P hydroxylase [Alteromonas pelagimontana]QJR82220.1 elongation factor P hydroxylase [Alteromonas pelagimontana]
MLNVNSVDNPVEQPCLDVDPEVDTLIDLFNQTFYPRFNTKLTRGKSEPIYLPADDTTPHCRIVFAHGFFSSALHEIAHWCIAGAKRRELEDYGYWYCPDGRNSEQQRAFEQAEVKPQAIEWAFTLALGRKFSVSTDNLNGAEPDRKGFTLAVEKQLLTYIGTSFPPRAAMFIEVLQQHFRTSQLCSRTIYREAI